MKRRFDSIIEESDRILLSRLTDLCDLADKRGKPCFSAFLNEHEQALTEQYGLLNASEVRCFFQGGFEDAQRRVFCAVAPDYADCISLDETDYPFTALTILFPKGYTVSHRDVLGSLMALRIKREAVGDILVGDCLAVVFLLNAAAELALSELEKIGNIGVECRVGKPQVLPPAFKTETCTGIVSAMRLDAVVAVLTGTSRADSVRLITQGCVQNNAQTQSSVSKEIKEGDKLSIRGFGKFVISAIGSPTKKGRLHITYLKYV
ncbi:RNA-binding protein [Oscillospiraceae bacterium LTW-04]|nr:YlmH/Sll1252 family protein [Oscillospiraceae bacterium MB24-C1]